MKLRCVSTVVVLLWTVVGVCAQERSEVEEWRDVLRYGMNSEITALFADVTEREDDALEAEAAELFVETRSQGVQEAAIDYLITLESDAAVGPVEERLQAFQDFGDAEVALYLRYLDARSPSLQEMTVSALQDLATRGNEAVRAAAIRVLAGGGTDASFLMEMYRDGETSPALRGEIILALGALGDEAALPLIDEILAPDSAEEAGLQRYALSALAEIGGDDALPTIERYLQDSDPLTRAYAVGALRAFDHTQDALMSALRDDYWRVRVSALETIAERGYDGASDAVAYRAGRDPEERVRLEAIETLGALNSAAGWNALSSLLEQRDTRIAEKRLIILLGIEHEPARFHDQVVEIVDTEWDRDNSALLDAVGRGVSAHGTAAYRDVIERMLHHRSITIQVYATRAVAAAGIGALREELESRTTETSHPTLRSAAVRALEEM